MSFNGVQLAVLGPLDLHIWIRQVAVVPWLLQITAKQNRETQLIVVTLVSGTDII